MRIIFVPMLLSVSLFASPASARTGPQTQSGGASGGVAVNPELRQIDSMVGRARDTGSISRREARQLRREIERLEALSARNGAAGSPALQSPTLETRTMMVRGIVNAPINRR